MRFSMLLFSVGMMTCSIFCIANGTVSFISIAFIIGLLYLLMGICEFLIGLNADFNISGRTIDLTKDGIIFTIIGLLILSGYITDNASAQSIFAIWILIEGIISIDKKSFFLSDNSGGENIVFVSNVLMILLSIYIFLNDTLLYLPSVLLIGVAIFLMGIKRFLKSFDIEYINPGFITGNKQKLENAIAEEKSAMKKAKQAIREQKIAQRKIEKIQQRINEERDVLNDSALRKQFLESTSEKNSDKNTHQ